MQSQCKPNAMKCNSIAEAQPDFANFLAKIQLLPKSSKFILLNLPKISLFSRFSRFKAWVYSKISQFIWPNTPKPSHFSSLTQQTTKARLPFP
jgi:hypothetical protein